MTGSDTFYTRTQPTAMPPMGSSVQVYEITIVNDNSGASPPADGFVNPEPITGYGLSFATTPASLTPALTTANRRGNLRYREILNQIQMVSNCYVLPSSITNNATAIIEATSLTFQVWLEHGESSMVTADESNPGEVLTGTDAITRCIARAMSIDLSNRVVDIFDPTSSKSVPSTTTSVPRYGDRINAASAFDCEPYAADIGAAEAMITVARVVL